MLLKFFFRTWRKIIAFAANIGVDHFEFFYDSALFLVGVSRWCFFPIGNDGFYLLHFPSYCVLFFGMPFSFYPLHEAKTTITSYVMINCGPREVKSPLPELWMWILFSQLIFCKKKRRKDAGVLYLEVQRSDCFCLFWSTSVHSCILFLIVADLGQMMTHRREKQIFHRLW